MGTTIKDAILKIYLMIFPQDKKVEYTYFYLGEFWIECKDNFKQTKKEK